MKIKLKDASEFNKLLIIKGFSQRALGRAIGITEAFANQIATGNRNPGPETAKKIVELLQVNFDDIFFIDDAHFSKREEQAVSSASIAKLS